MYVMLRVSSARVVFNRIPLSFSLPTSVQVCPDPLYSLGQVQENEPGVSWQTAFLSQVCISARHSSIFLQTVPFQVKPNVHWHIEDPGELLHWGSDWQLWSLREHSFTLKHCFPFPEYPRRHWQEYDPTVSWQRAFSWHKLMLEMHSFVFEQFFPSPWNPALHVHINDPWMFSQVLLP